MADTDMRFTLPDDLRAQVEAAARRSATTPQAWVEAAVARQLDVADRRARLSFFGERAARDGLSDERVEELVGDAVHAYRRERRARDE